MDKTEIINHMLEIHRQYRKSFIDDLEAYEKKFEILKLLMNRAINESVGTYNLEKGVVKLQKVTEMNALFHDMGISNSQINDIWKQSLYIVLGCENTVVDVEQYVNLNLQHYKEILQIGMAADVSRGQLEFDKLKIMYMNKQRR